MRYYFLSKYDRKDLAVTEAELGFETYGFDILVF